MSLEDLREPVDLLLYVLFRLLPQPHELLLLAVMDLGLLLPLLLQGGCNCLVLPANLMSQASQVGELPRRLQTHHLEGGRHHHALFLVIGWRDPIEHLETVQGGLPSLGLMGQHASHRPPEDAAGGSEVVGASGRVGIHALAEEGQVLQFVSVKIARNVDALTAHNHHLPAQKYLLGHNGRQAAQEMASAIEHQHLLEIG